MHAHTDTKFKIFENLHIGKNIDILLYTGRYSNYCHSTGHCLAAIRTLYGMYVRIDNYRIGKQKIIVWYFIKSF